MKCRYYLSEIQNLLSDKNIIHFKIIYTTGNISKIIATIAYSNIIDIKSLGLSIIWQKAYVETLSKLVLPIPCVSPPASNTIECVRDVLYTTNVILQMFVSNKISDQMILFDAKAFWVDWCEHKFLSDVIYTIMFFLSVYCVSKFVDGFLVLFLYLFILPNVLKIEVLIL